MKLQKICHFCKQSQNQYTCSYIQNPNFMKIARVNTCTCHPNIEATTLLVLIALVYIHHIIIIMGASLSEPHINMHTIYVWWYIMCVPQRPHGNFMSSTHAYMYSNFVNLYSCSIHCMDQSLALQQQ